MGMKLPRKQSAWYLDARPLVIAVCAATLIGCSKSSSSGGGTTPTTISGAVTAPGGALAFNGPSQWQRMLASVFAGYADAAITGVSNVGAGVTINLIEVDASGVQVGAVLATTTTASDGSYTLEAPTGFTPGPQYVVRAEGTTENLDARVIDTTVDVDPITSAASGLITSTATDLATLSVEEVATILEAVEDLAQDIDPTSLTTAQLTTELTTAVSNDEEANNIVTSTVASGEICGNVKDSSSNNLANIRIVVRDYGNWVTRNKTLTDTAGNYCVNVPNGSYIVGALNFTGSSFAASEWSGNAYNQFDATPVVVSGSTPQTVDFTLEPGGRISGSVTAGAGGSLAQGTALEKVTVVVRAYSNLTPVAFTKVKADGSYRLNVIPGDYLIEIRNTTLQPYATEYYSSTGGSPSMNGVDPVSVALSTTVTADAELEPGYMLYGQIVDNTTDNNPVTGVRIRVDSNNGPSARIRTNKDGRYRVWLAPASYAVMSYGSRAATVDLSSMNQQQNFAGPVGTITGVVKDSGSQPLSQVKVFLYDTTDPSGSTSPVLINQELTDSDGTFTLYSTNTETTRVLFMIDEAQAYGSSVWNGQTQHALASPEPITLSMNNDLGTITLPDAGVLIGRVMNINGTAGDTSDDTPRANDSVQVRAGGTGAGNRFMQVRTRGDGTFAISLPAGTYENVRIGGGTGVSNLNVNITAGSTTDLGDVAY